MRPKIIFPTWLCVVMVFLASAIWAAAQTPGNVVIAKIKGDVNVIGADGKSAAAKEGMKITQGSTIVTGADGSATLLFSNGSLINLGKESKLKVDEFTQKPAAAVAGVMEKGVSRTLLNLSQGEVTGNVNKLNPDSVYEIKTPVGVAGIRGTKFIITIRKDPKTNSYKAVFSVGSGKIEVNIGSGAGQLLGDSDSLIITADVNMTTGVVTVQNKQIGQITAAELQILKNLARPPNSTLPGGETTHRPPPPPPPPPPPANPTPGAGQ